MRLAASAGHGVAGARSARKNHGTYLLEIDEGGAATGSAAALSCCDRRAGKARTGRRRVENLILSAVDKEIHRGDALSAIAHTVYAHVGIDRPDERGNIVQLFTSTVTIVPRGFVTDMAATVT